jgi:hypothetical protein
MTSAVQIAAQKLTAEIDLKTLKTLVEKTHAQKFGDLRKRSTWELAYFDLQQNAITELDDMEFEPYFTSCKGNTCSAILPVLPEDEKVLFFFPEDSDDIEEFRELLDNSLLNQEPIPLFDLDGYVKQTIKRLSQLSLDWCLREARGFMSIVNGQFTKFTTRTPRRVMRKASRFIAEICKASKGMLHAQYSK